MFCSAVIRTSLRRSAASATVLARSAATPIARIHPGRLQQVRWNSKIPTAPDLDDPKLSDEERKRLAREFNNELQKDWRAPVVTYEQLKPKTEAPAIDEYLIDVREPDEVVQGSIPSSVNLPLSVISGSLHLGPEDFKDKHGFDKPTKDQQITFYCRSGKRSASASDIARRNGFLNVYNYEGSWLDWTAREGGKPSS